MRSLPVSDPTSKTFYAHLRGASGLLGKLGATVFFLDDQTHALVEVTNYEGLTVLGRADISETQKIMDRLHGGYAAVACQRRHLEVA